MYVSIFPPHWSVIMLLRADYRLYKRGSLTSMSITEIESHHRLIPFMCILVAVKPGEQLLSPERKKNSSPDETGADELESGM